jgi:hypothetical protein
MKTEERLVEQVLGERGFSLSYIDHASGELAFFKPCLHHSGLFERVYIQVSGRKPKLVASAGVGIACVRGRFSWRGLAERFCVLAVATNKARGQAELKTEDAWRAWLTRFNDLIPSQMLEAREKFVTLLEERTIHARNASQRYLRRLGFPCCVNTAKENLSAIASEEQVVEANLALSHQIGWLANPTYHFTAVLAVRCLSPEVEPNVTFNYEDPSEDTPLMWRVHLIVDHLMAYPKQMALIFSREAGLGYSLREPLVLPDEEVDGSQ